MPITIGAEQGLLGLAAYAAVLAAAFLTLFGNVRAGRAPPELDGDASGGFVPARAALAAMFCALVLHTLGYAAFLEDPFTWVLLAMGVAVAPYAVLAMRRPQSSERATLGKPGDLLASRR
jgi:O-antigen ligase